MQTNSTYASVLPGYHQNKEHWNTVILDGTVPAEDIKRMIAESYDLVVSKKKYKVKCTIPKDKKIEVDGEINNEKCKNGTSQL